MFDDHNNKNVYDKPDPVGFKASELSGADSSSDDDSDVDYDLNPDDALRMSFDANEGLIRGVNADDASRISCDANVRMNRDESINSLISLNNPSTAIISFSELLCCDNSEAHVFESTITKENSNEQTLTIHEESLTNDVITSCTDTISSWSVSTRIEFERSIELLLSSAESPLNTIGYGVSSYTEEERPTGFLRDQQGAQSAEPPSQNNFEAQYWPIIHQKMMCLGDPLTPLSSSTDYIASDEDAGFQHLSKVTESGETTSSSASLLSRPMSTERYRARLMSPRTRSKKLQNLRRKLSIESSLNKPAPLGSQPFFIANNIMIQAPDERDDPSESRSGVDIRRSQSLDEHAIIRQKRRQQKKLRANISAMSITPYMHSNNKSVSSQSMGFTKAFKMGLTCGAQCGVDDDDDYESVLAGHKKWYGGTRGDGLSSRSEEYDVDVDAPEYDSDPEDFQSGYRNSLNLLSSRAKENSSHVTRQRIVNSRFTDEDEEFDDDQDAPLNACDSRLEPIDHHREMRDKPLNIHNENHVYQKIEETIHTDLTLIWHPISDGSLDDNNVIAGGQQSAPTCVKAWIELGARLKDHVVQPKFVWKDAYSTNDLAGRAQTGASTSLPLGSVELLDIARVLTSARVDRKKFPLANPSKSFIILTADQQRLLFEVANQKERDKIVSGLKLIVARLASMIIVGDESLFDEFFYSAEANNRYRKSNW
eukprot:CAMPEP_0198295036 /NCGR_PEP_ID=MMETSP1449-20131203/25447_1 /TAXON_ID=420275 /ORGANISM="Attheya septentrionalis, Strain CCMP2084" /LENGTH=708 /DNA_ID=CAMNT_0043995199 /DNA_START=224 /DNA_END=2347 /DNA_ORIENTATION=+